MLTRIHMPPPPLGHHVALMWLQEGFDGPHTKERVLPDGCASIVINLREDAIRMFDREDPERFDTFRGSILGGPRAEYFVIDRDPSDSIFGIHFHPGGAYPFVESPLVEIGQSLSLDDIWGRTAGELRERLLEAATPEAKFAAAESVLLGRLSSRATLHPGVVWASVEIRKAPSARRMEEIAGAIGISQRRFSELFRHQVGFTPKVYARLRRFQSALAEAAQGGEVRWAEVALSAGYYDQAHFNKDFREFSGLNPNAYLARRAGHHNHVALV